MRCRPAACPSPEHRPSRPSIESLMRNPRRSRVSTTAISVELVNAEDNSQIWGQQYNRKLADVFAVQEDERDFRQAALKADRRRAAAACEAAYGEPQGFPVLLAGAVVHESPHARGSARSYSLLRKGH